MTFLEVLVEGGSDESAVREILRRRFRMVEDRDFRIHPHKGKGELPANPMARPDPRRRGILDQLPAKLRAYGHFPEGYSVVVLLDADSERCEELKSRLVTLYRDITPRPLRVLFRIAVEELESWFIAEPIAIRKAFPKANLNRLPSGPPDRVIGAWECLAKTLGRRPQECVGADKWEWAEKITPHLDLDDPKSPSLNAFIRGIQGLKEQGSGQ
jgi:hypothetical protein